MNDLDWIHAAELALPDDAKASQLTRLRMLGLDQGPLHPLHFTVQGELHLALEGIELHRTKLMPPTDKDGVTPAAAFIGYAATARVVDLIKVGDWLLHGEHMSTIDVAELALRDKWRPGARQALWILPYLDGRSRSLKESETRALLIFGGLPWPEVNVDLYEDGIVLACVDLLFPKWRLVVEYEGRQHAEDHVQFNKDIGRYAWLRGEKWEYVQVTQEKLKRPRAVVLDVYEKLVEHGYDGPAPVFAARWQSLFGRVPTTRRFGGDLASKTELGMDASPPPRARGGR